MTDAYGTIFFVETGAVAVAILDTGAGVVTIFDVGARTVFVTVVVAAAIFVSVGTEMTFLGELGWGFDTGYAAATTTCLLAAIGLLIVVLPMIDLLMLGLLGEAGFFAIPFG